jgi:hypothetical protein
VILCLLYERLGGGAGVGEGLVEEGLVPRVAVEEERGRVWADVRGLPVAEVAENVVQWAWERRLTGVRCGAASAPVTAYAAAAVRGGGEGGAEVVVGGEREYLAPLPLELLEPEDRLLDLLEGVGVETCGALAALEREAVEVRFGEEAVRVWRWARASDERRLFRPVPQSAPSASLDFVDYVVTDPERLLFTANALLGHVCDALTEQGAHARSLTLALALANGEEWRRSIGTARPTASRATWLRRIRSTLERLTVPDAVTGVSLVIDATVGAATIQGDLFDAGFATAASVEAAIERLIEVQGPVLVQPAPSEHPLPEQRTGFTEADPEGSIAGTVRGGGVPAGAPGRAGNRRSDAQRSPTQGPGHEGDGGAAHTGPDPEAQEDTDVAVATNGSIVDDAVGLTLQLLKAPRPVLVETVERRDHMLPVRYRDGAWRAIVTAAGPDRVSGGQWENAYAREYYRCVTAQGTLVWLFRDGCGEGWYLHGWWD